jgi:glycosyltransferase involved in cell wall biosynthesis
VKAIPYLTRRPGTGRGLDVLYVGTLPPHPGGSAMVGADLVCGLARLGHRVRALAPITPAARRGGDRFAHANRGVAVTRFTVPRFENAPNTPASREYRAQEGRRLGAGLRRLLANARPDVIVIGRETFAWHVPDIAAAHDIPTVQLAQGSTTAGITSGAIPRATGRRLIAQLGRADTVVLVARHLRRVYRAWRVPRLHVIQNGVDLDAFAPRAKSAALLRRLRIAAGDVVVMHASNLKDLKRPLDLVIAAASALRTNPRLVFVIAGDGNLRTAMAAACRRLGIAHAFRFVGWVDHDEMPRWIGLADVVVMPSATEALALVYLETLAAGRVLLATDIPAAREVVRDGRDGVLFPVGDVAVLAARMLELAARPDLRRAIGARARSTARRFAIDRVVARYATVLTRVVRRRRAAERSRPATRAVGR